ncbi:MAG: hypothetical protein JJT99_09220 [Rhodobacteraceae bacterium]|nr:hypothetical protein [Paracoccaceae bacterium]
MKSDREISYLVRADILHLLWGRGDRRDRLTASHLTLQDYSDFFPDSAKWLEREGLVAFGNRQENATTGQIVFASAQLTAKGESFLRSNSADQKKAIIEILTDAFRDAAKVKLSEAIRSIPLIIWTAYETWKP